MSTDVAAALAAQGLDASDLNANRAGRITERQLDRQRTVRVSGGGFVKAMAGIMIFGTSGFGLWRYLGHGELGLMIFMILLGAVFAAFPLGIYYAFRFADPARVAMAKVVRLENAEVGVFLPASNRGVYAISLNRQRYSGFATELRRAHFGKRVNAYVVPEHRIVVALEPIDSTAA